MPVQLGICPYKRLPDKTTPGTFIFCKDTPSGPELFLAARDGTLCNVSQSFEIKIVGDGAQGAPGRDGRDGKDGRDGVDGQRGEKGATGDVLYVDSEQVKVAHRKILERRAAALAAVRDALLCAESYPPGARILVERAINTIKEKI